MKMPDIRYAWSFNEEYGFEGRHTSRRSAVRAAMRQAKLDGLELPFSVFTARRASNREAGITREERKEQGLAFCVAEIAEHELSPRGVLVHTKLTASSESAE
jgi:hypothetical protein